MAVPPDDIGPTAERIKQAGGWYDAKKNNPQFFTAVGNSRSSRKFAMLDDALGRAWVKRIISAQEYSALKQYALHWLAGGLQGQLGSVDLNRVLAFNPGTMTGLAKTEAQADHRAMYWRAHDFIGTRPAFVVDHMACHDCSVQQVATMLGYRSPYRGREIVRGILSDSGYRLARFWDDCARGH